MPNDPLPIAVIGCGRMGRLHAKTLVNLPEARLVGVFDADPARAQAVSSEFHCPRFDSLESAIAAARAAVIAVPTEFHLSVARSLLGKQIPCLIEKPLARNSAEAQTLADFAAKHQTFVQVGHIERFNPAIRALFKLGISPRFMETSRISPLPFRSLDVGVVLDMMIHDIDILLALANSPVQRIDASGLAVIGPSEDMCNARLLFENGCVANLTASRLALKTERRLRLYSRDTFVSIDYQQRTGAIIRKAGNVESIHQAMEQLKTGQVTDPSQIKFPSLIKMEPLETDGADPLRAQAQSFISAVQNSTQPVVSAAAGVAAVEVAEKIAKQILP